MKSIHTIFLAALLFTGISFAFTKVHRTETAASPGFALVELYTSEGCSSCPPADKLLAKIAQEYKDKEVYLLAYHVDYWNRLGWKDVFSSPQYSERQRAYANYLKVGDGVYTPQAIVNGRTEFIGSDEAKMNSVIKQALGQTPSGHLELSVLKQSSGKASLHYQASGIPGGSNLVLAVIKKYAQTQVKAGENNGRMLPHINIVQKLQSINLKNDTGNAEVSLPDGFNGKDWAIVGFVQSSSNGAILAVQKVTDNKELAAIN